MNKIYWSKTCDPEQWPDSVKSYWFPKAEWLMGRTWGRNLIKAYLIFRSWFEKGER